MFKLRLFFVSSLVILAGAFIALIYFVPSGESYAESKKARVIEGETEWTLQYDIVNNQETDIEYIIHITVDGITYSDSAVVKPGKTYTYIRRIYLQQIEDKKVVLSLYRAGETGPVEEVTYYIDSD